MISNPVLNYRSYNFSEMDLRGIRVPGADLSKAILDTTALDNADLSGVNLTGATLRDASLSQCNMSGVAWHVDMTLTVHSIYHTVSICLSHPNTHSTPLPSYM